MKCPEFIFYQGLASGSYSVLAVGDGGAAATSGQGTTDPATGARFTDPNDIEAQVRQVLSNGRDALAKGGLSLADVDYVSIFHTNSVDEKKILHALSNSLVSFRHEFMQATQLPGGQNVEIEFYTRSFMRLLEAGILKRENFKSDEADPVEAVNVIMHRINDFLNSTSEIIQARITLPLGTLNKLGEVNAVYASFFDHCYPIRSSSAGLDDITRVEITFTDASL